MNEIETEKNQKTIRISEQMYNRLSDLGTVKQSFNDVIERLINFYEAHNTGMHSSSIEVLKESVDFPVDDEGKKIALQFFEGVLSLGNDVSFTLRLDSKETPLIENRKNNVIFYKGNMPLCLIRTVIGMVWRYLPTNKANTTFPGWKDEHFLAKSVLERELQVIKRVYEDMKM